MKGCCSPLISRNKEHSWLVHSLCFVTDRLEFKWNWYKLTIRLLGHLNWSNDNPRIFIGLSFSLMLVINKQS